MLGDVAMSLQRLSRFERCAIHLLQVALGAFEVFPAFFDNCSGLETKAEIVRAQCFSGLNGAVCLSKSSACVQLPASHLLRLETDSRLA